MSPKFIPLVVSILVNAQNQTVMSENITFPADIQLWCPYTQFCDLEAKYPLPSQGQHDADKFRPCCESCSCSPDCGLKRKCCKDEFDLYKIDESLGTICKQLNSRAEAFRGDAHYYMVDKCPGKQESCRFQNVSNWRSYSPVYSRSNSMIYYNIKCAECHKQTDLVEFIPSVACPVLNKPFSSILQNVVEAGNDECYLQFLVPSDIDISAEVCYPYLKRDCKARNTPEAAKMKELCESFNATFRLFSDYQNIYCYLCGLDEPDPGQKWIEDNTICPATDSKRFLTRSSILVLLDDDSVNNYEALQSKDAINKLVCVDTVTNSTTKACRPVFCPVGQIRVNSVCKAFGHGWYLQEARLFIKLTPLDSSLNLDLLHQISNEQLASQDKAFLSSPELQDWEMELFYRTHENKTTIRYVLAILFLRTQIVRPELLIKDIEQSLRENWKLNISGTVFCLKAELNRYITYIPYVHEKEVRLAPHLLYRHQILREEWVVPWSPVKSFNYMSSDIHITKLFFCEQVSFQPGEFDIATAKVYLLALNKSLGDGEFIASLDPGGNYREIRVCLSDVLVERNGTFRRLKHLLVVYVGVLSIYKSFFQAFFETF